MKAGDVRRRKKPLRKATSVLEIILDTMEEVGGEKTCTKLSAIMGNTSHLLGETVVAQRLHEGFCSTFISSAIRAYHSALG